MSFGHVPAIIKTIGCLIGFPMQSLGIDLDTSDLRIEWSAKMHFLGYLELQETVDQYFWPRF